MQFSRILSFNPTQQDKLLGRTHPIQWHQGKNQIRQFDKPNPTKQTPRRHPPNQWYQGKNIRQFDNCE